MNLKLTMPNGSAKQEPTGPNFEDFIFDLSDLMLNLFNTNLKGMPMKKRQWLIRFSMMFLVAALMFSLPAAVFAQETDPPVAPEDPETSANDILVFEPRFSWEFPFGDGFKIAFHFAISFEVPRQISLVQDEVFDLILNFSSFIKPGALAEPETETP